MNSSRTMPHRRPDATPPSARRTVSLAAIDTRAPRAQRSTDRLIDTHGTYAVGGEFNSSI